VYRQYKQYSDIKALYIYICTFQQCVLSASIYKCIVVRYRYSGLCLFMFLCWEWNPGPVGVGGAVGGGCKFGRGPVIPNNSVCFQSSKSLFSTITCATSGTNTPTTSRREKSGHPGLIIDKIIDFCVAPAGRFRQQQWRRGFGGKHDACQPPHTLVMDTVETEMSVKTILQ
jgi:hypothetical protein